MSALAWSAGARAQALEVTSEDRCITEAGLRAAMQRYAARVAPDPALRVTVRPAKSALSFVLLRDGAVLAERDFETLPQRCSARVRAVAIAIALALESVQERQPAANDSADGSVARGDASPAPAPTAPQRSEQTSAERAADAATPPPDPQREAAEPVSPPQTDDATAEPEPEVDAEDAAEPDAEPDATRAGAASVVLQAGGGALIAVLPEPAVVLMLGAGFSLGAPWRLELSGLASPGVTSELAGGVVDAQLYGGQCMLCAGMPLGAFRAAGCAGLAAAAVPARGRDFAVSARSTLTGWTAALLAATLDVPVVEPVSLRFSAGLYGSFVLPTLEARVDGERRDATPFPIASLLSLHVLWALP